MPFLYFLYFLRSGWPAAAWVCLLMGLHASAGAAEIYTCVDSKGRKITADRPIAECMDRAQTQLNSSGSVKRHVQPEMTAQEKVAQEAKDRKLADERARLDDEKRRDRALLLRYPSLAVHNKERQAALALVDDVILSANKRQQDLAEQRKAIDSQLEFYASNPAKIPHVLKRSLEANQAGVAEQIKFIASQGEEKKRINQRFDTELAQLRVLWASVGAGVATAPAVPASASRAY